MPTLTVVPNPTKPERVDVAGSGFDPAMFVALVFDGSGTSIKIPVKRDGSFAVGQYVASTKPDGTYKLEARKYGTSTVLASMNVVVKRVAVPPPPPPPPPPDAAPAISNVIVTPTATGAEVRWHVSEFARGWIKHGPTTAYGSETPHETSFTYQDHVQTISGYGAAVPVSFSIVAEDTAGQRGESPGTFTTLGATTPPPPPPPTGTRPFPSPVAPNVVIVPAGANVQSIVNAAPNGTEFRFSGAEHVMANGIYLRDRHNLVFTGNGSTIRCTGTDGSTATSPFKLDNLNSDIAIRNFTLRGTNPNTTTLYVRGLEYQMGVAVYDGVRIEIDNVRVRNVYGDGVYVAGKQSSPYRSSDGVWAHDSSFDYIGRMGIVHNAALNSTTERCTFDHVGLFVYDIECDYDFEVVDKVAFRDNTIGSYGHSPEYTNWLFACSGGSAVAKVSNIAFERNTVTTGAPINSPHNTGAKGGLASIIERGSRIANVSFKGNSTTKSGAGAVLHFVHIDGLTVTGNTQPLTSGSLVAVSDSTNVVTSPNP